MLLHAVSFQLNYDNFHVRARSAFKKQKWRFPNAKCEVLEPSDKHRIKVSKILAALR